AEIIEDEQRAPAQPVRQQDRAVRLAPAQRRGADRAHAEPAPLRARPTIVETGEPGVEIARHRDLASPALVATPAEARQIVADRAQRIGAIVPDVAPAVAVEIHR